MVKAAGFLDENHYHYDGFILTLRLAKLTPFVYLPDPLMEKREHAGGTSKGISFSEKERCFQDVLAEVMRVTDELPEKDKRAIRKEWLAKISELSVKAKMEEGDWSGAWMEIVRRVVNDPRRLKGEFKNGARYTISGGAYMILHLSDLLPSGMRTVHESEALQTPMMRRSSLRLRTASPPYQQLSRS